MKIPRGIFFLIMVFPLAATAGEGNDAAVFAVRNVRVFDGRRVMENAVVVVKDGKVLAAGPAVAVPTGAQIIDGTGKTILPGLIDSHTHVFGNALEQSIVFGVTTDIDMFTDVSLVKEAKKGQEEGKASQRADLFSSGTLVTAPGGHGTEYGLRIPTIASATEAQAFVDARIAEGSDFIKIIYGPPSPVIDRETMAAVISAAHKRGKLAVVHVTDYKAAQEAVAAAADGLAHVFPDQIAGPEFIRSAAKRPIFIIPTMTVVRSLCGLSVEDAFLNDPGLAPFLGPQDMAKLKITFPFPSVGKYENAEKTMALLKEAKIPVLAGTDAPNPGTIYGASLHYELELLVRIGLTPAEALAAATSIPAATFGLKDRGRIAAGLRADLILVDGNPVEDIKALRRIASIWKGGTPFDREPVRKKIEKQKAESKKTEKSAAPPGLEAGLISDFEDGTTAAKFGAGWSLSTDSFAGGKSKAEWKVVEDGAAGTKRSLQVKGEVASGLAYAWSGVAYFPGAVAFSPADLSAKKELVFWAKGEAKSFVVLAFLQDRGFIPVSVPVKLDKEWREIVIPFTEFGKTDGRNVTAISMAASPDPGPFTFQIDEVRLR